MLQTGHPKELRQGLGRPLLASISIAECTEALRTYKPGMRPAIAKAPSEASSHPEAPRDTPPTRGQLVTSLNLLVAVSPQLVRSLSLQNALVQTTS